MPTCRELERFNAAEIERSERKLGNQGFVAQAPPEVVQAERDKVARLRLEPEALELSPEEAER